MLLDILVKSNLIGQKVINIGKTIIFYNRSGGKRRENKVGCESMQKGIGPDDEQIMISVRGQKIPRGHSMKKFMKTAFGMRLIITISSIYIEDEET